MHILFTILYLPNDILFRKKVKRTYFINNNRLDYLGYVIIVINNLNVTYCAKIKSKFFLFLNSLKLKFGLSRHHFS